MGKLGKKPLLDVTKIFETVILLYRIIYIQDAVRPSFIFFNL